MYWWLLFVLTIWIFISFLNAQYLGSSLYTALSGYGGMNDMCRYISCPFGQYCFNGNCMTNAAALGGFGGGLSSLTNAAALYSGRTGLLGGYGGYGGAYGGYGALGGLGGGYGLTGMGALTPGIGGVSGVQPCNLMQQCLNGQICVNGYCEKSNVAYAGSQIAPQQSTCLTGAVCPVGEFCMGGTCIKNPMSTTFACQNGISCPPGMICQLGRCLANGLPYFGIGKKK